jgi:hypothetical protein
MEIFMQYENIAKRPIRKYCLKRKNAILTFKRKFLSICINMLNVEIRVVL